ncbi:MULTISPECIES: hypothetical protein [Halolactibacillus]|uniref:hypothetical protein n=1 Tax=Halolactibacillus TaxID=306539 RepID=UPI001C9A12CB|nr:MULTISPECIES: hypothetical protein [Halolactibacillus]
MLNFVSFIVFFLHATSSESGKPTFHLNRFDPVYTGADTFSFMFSVPQHNHEDVVVGH